MPRTRTRRRRSLARASFGPEWTPAAWWLTTPDPTPRERDRADAAARARRRKYAAVIRRWDAAVRRATCGPVAL